ncbi:MAG: hypothetical protein P0S95_08170 [Rhabdochlamydiaceae bacterium]|nr:hypothetical protein [Candidatus Amphrikana amoebophyrae]
MQSPDYHAPIGEMKNQLTSIREMFHSIKSNPTSIDSPENLSSLASTIKDLDIESQMGQKDKSFKMTCELIHHLLCTPWGAPFVMQTSLLEAAQSFKFQEHSKSELYTILRDIIKHTDASEKQIFETIDDAIEHLNNQKKTMRGKSS